MRLGDFVQQFPSLRSSRSVVGLVGVSALVLLGTVTPVAAAACDNGEHTGNPHCVADPDPAATPELGSAALLASGLIGMAGYGMMRVRAGRKRD